MPRYKYVGIDKQGRRVRGVLDEESDARVLQRLYDVGIEPISIKPIRSGLFTFHIKRPVSRRQLIIFTSQVEQLLQAGVPLLTSLESLYEAFEEPEMKELVASLLDDLQKGRTLSESIAAHPSIFSPVYISLIRVGEQTGRLDEVLKELTEMLKWEDELVAKAKKIMIYPAIVLAVVLGVVIMMMLFVVPQLLDFIKEMGGELGMPTQALIATSNFVQQYILLILIFPFIIAFILRYARQKFTLFRYKTDCMLLGIPIIGEVFYKIKLSRLSSSLASMYSAGIGFSEALELSKKVVNNLCLEERLDEANRFIQQGELIHSAFRLTSIFPLMAIYMLQAGEQSGRLDSGLRNISYFLDRDVNERIEKIEPMIEPVITVLLAVIVGWVMMAVLGPIYDMMTKIKF